MYDLLLPNHKTSKSNFCVKLLSCKRNFVAWNFWGRLPREPPKMGHPKIYFLNGLSRGASFFDFSRYLTDNYFDISWGYHPPWGPPKRTPKNQLFKKFKLGCQFLFWYEQIFYRQRFWHSLGCLPLGPPKNQFFEWHNLGC